MATVGIFEAKNRLSELVERAARGEPRPVDSRAAVNRSRRALDAAAKPRMHRARPSRAGRAASELQRGRMNALGGGLSIR